MKTNIPILRARRSTPALLAVLIAAATLALMPSGRLAATEPTRALAHSMPAGAIGYVEVSGLAPVIDRIRDSDDLRVVLQSAPFRQVEKSKGFRRLRAGRRIAETQLGLDLWTLAGKLLGDRVAVGLYAPEGRTEPDLVAILRVADAGIVAHVRERLDPFLVLGSDHIDASESIAGVEVLGVDGKAFVAFRDNWVAASNSRELLTKALELLSGEDRPCLARDENFRAMTKQAGADHLARLYVNAEAIREARGGRFAPEKLDNPLGSLLVGGILEMAVNSPYLEAHLDLTDTRISLAASIAGDTEKLDEAHRSFFSSPSSRGAAPIPAPPHTIGGFAVYRDFASWYRHREELLEARVLPGFDQFESGLANLLPGKDFAEDVLPLIGSGLTFVSARQKYDHLDGKPGVELPGFALIVEMKDPAKAARIFRLFFQTLSLVLNVQAGQQGREPWVMASETHEGVQISFTEYLERPSGERLGFVFNFMPSSALVGDKFVISSSLDLCRQLVSELKKAPLEASGAVNRNLNFEIHADALAEILQANRDFFHARLIQAGQTRDEAAKQFAQIMKILRSFDLGRLSTTVLPDALRAQLEVHWK